MDLIDSLRQAYKRMTTAGEEVIEATLAYAQLLLEARRSHPSNEAFAVWLAAHELDELSKDDRAALLNIAEHPDLFRDCMAVPGPRSWRRVWTDEMQPRVRTCAKTDDVPPASPIADSLAEETPDSRAVDPPKSDPPIPAASTLSVRERALSPLKGLPHFELVHAHVQSKATRTMLGGITRKKGGRAIWDLLIAMIQQGAFGPPTMADVGRPNLRVLFPWAPHGYAQRFNLLQRDDLVAVREQIVPVVLAHTSTLHQDPHQLVRLLAEASAVKRQAALESRQVEQAVQHRVAVAALPTTEQEIVMYGQALWPSVLPTRWTYRELQEACWYYRVMAPMLEAVQIHRKQAHVAQEVRQNINLGLKWLPIRATPFAEAVRQIGLAYEANPEGECRVAPAPVNFGLS